MTKAQKAALDALASSTDDQIRAMTCLEYVAFVRRSLRALGFTGSVRNGRGTAYGWVEIWQDARGSTFSPENRAILIDAGLGAGGNFTNISPDGYVAAARRLREYAASR